MNKYRFILVFSLIGLIGAAISNLFIKNPNKSCWEILEEEKQIEFTGIIEEKNRDKEERNLPYLKIRISGTKHPLNKSMGAERSGIYDFVQIGDSIIKESGTLVWTIKRDTIVKRIKYTRFCNEHEKYDEE